MERVFLSQQRTAHRRDRNEQAFVDVNFAKIIASRSFTEQEVLHRRAVR